MDETTSDISCDICKKLVKYKDTKVIYYSFKTRIYQAPDRYCLECIKCIEDDLCGYCGKMSNGTTPCTSCRNQYR